MQSSDRKGTSTIKYPELGVDRTGSGECRARSTQHGSVLLRSDPWRFVDHGITTLRGRTLREYVTAGTRNDDTRSL